MANLIAGNVQLLSDEASANVPSSEMDRCFGHVDGKEWKE